ncbi:MAG: hypothetical protein M1823_005307 [Watsoniomyces obsoletus]|nr:MAG: hypothetical protein M1823_005307 [Watsoniomyces obsoletus]
MGDGKPSHDDLPELAYSLSGLQAPFLAQVPAQVPHPPPPPPIGPTPQPPPGASGGSRLADIPYLPREPRHAHEQQQQRPASVSDLLPPRPVPAIQNITPTEGPPGTCVAVYLCSAYDLEAPPALRYSLMFGTQSCVGSLTKLNSEGQYLRYLLAATAPALSPAAWASPEVPIRLRVDDDAAGQPVGAVEVGQYTYTSPVKQSPAAYTSPPAASSSSATRKRKSSASPETRPIPTKRVSHQHLRTTSGDDVPTYNYSPVDGNLYRPQYYSPPIEGPPPPSTAPTTVTGYATSPTPAHYGHAASAARAISYPYAEGPMVPVTGASEPRSSGPPPPWSSPHSDVSSYHSHSPTLAAVAATARPQPSHLASPPGVANPPLIRTSTIPQSATSTSSLLPGSAAGGPAFNPYAMYPHKAVLKLQADLDSMAENWTVQEWDAKRRLVQFQRRQSGSTIYASCQPIAPEERAANSICISCIWWEEKNECYVTSVDTIYLLESLVAVRFTVEEKNRIRRNLEGFRPLTVSKGKADSEEFFKVVMGFPAPKPRNIEKDVKVFPWKVLSHALKKIISKYSASYSSTAGALGRPVSPSGYAMTGPPRSASNPHHHHQQHQHHQQHPSLSGSNHHHHHHHHPSNTSAEIGSPPDYHHTIASPPLHSLPNLHHPPSHHSGPTPLGSLGGGGNDLRLTVPHVTTHHITSSPRSQQPFVDATARTTTTTPWALGPYIDTELNSADGSELLMPSSGPPTSHE